ncbi:MAG: CoA transferase [Propionibacteriaceae bacterium]|jgi:CoA:oxalate CoA-transferase|nr:CoA transferase [Propionibacteriaceae bacterium]
MKALEGITVLDLSRVLAGPYTGMMLADNGANVIKIEAPRTGDDSRAFGPFVGKESAYFMSLNRNKRSIVMNFKNPEHVAAFKELVKHADVVLENYRPGTTDKLGIGYDVLKEINPRLIYAQCSGFGDTGPYRLKPAYDVVVQAMGGIMSITGQEGGEPTRVGASVGDVIAGIFTAFGVSTALVAREKTGVGQKLDISMLDCQVAVLENAIARYVTTGTSPVPIGNRHPSITPFAAFTASDGWVIVGAGNDKLWGGLCDLIGQPELKADPRFLTNGDRTNNVYELTPILNEAFSHRTMNEWLTDLEAAGLPCAPINNVEKIVNDPQIAAREMIVEVTHPVAGPLKMPGVPIKFSQTPGGVETPAPLLGQHTSEILQEVLGWSKEKADDFAAHSED